MENLKFLVKKLSILLAASPLPSIPLTVTAFQSILAKSKVRCVFLSPEFALKTQFFTILDPKKNILYFQFSQNALKCHYSQWDG